MEKRLLFLACALLLAAFIVACDAPEIVEVTRVVTETIEVAGESETVEVEVTRVVTETETMIEEVLIDPMAEEVAGHQGAWLDTIVFVEEPNQDSAIARLAAGDIDMFADDVAGAATVQAIEAAGNITAVTQYGLFDEIFFNNGACTDENTLNPFNNRAIREAMNWAIDRDFIVNEFYGGLAVPKFTPISEAGADRSRYAAVIREIEAKYAYDFERANDIIAAEMESLGAVLTDGKWTFAGEPVTIIALIRNDDMRLQIGNYVANQLEEMGFTIERVERNSAELSPIWLDSVPGECQWNFYTGAWTQTVVDRSSIDNFDFYYTPRGLPRPSWQVIEPTEAFDALSLRLFNNDFADLEERNALTEQILPMAAEFAPRVWIASRTTLVPFSNEVSVSTDLAAGISGAGIWGKTVRFKDQVGGSMTIALPNMLTEPWNPIGGSNWVFDNMVKRGIGEAGTYTDPNTGVVIPNRIERAEVVVQDGFPVTVSPSSDWLSLEFAPEIVVPDDAWAGWDAENQIFLTADEVFGERQTAVYKSTVIYPDDLFETISWHDGSPISVADFVMGMIVQFDLADPASPYYDESLGPDRAQFLSAFKGMRITSTAPLTIEYYGDNAQLDAESMLTTWYPANQAAYDFADAAWHNMAVMLRGEENGGVAFTSDKAAAKEIERTNLISGPSLAILAAELEGATAESFIPYAPTLTQFMTDGETAVRYANLAEFARRYGHYYLGTNVYFLSGVFPVEGQAVISRYDSHPDAANRFTRFAAPAVPEIEIDGDSRVTIGQEAEFDVFIDAIGGEPYAVDDISRVTYLLFDATGEQVAIGEATPIEDGHWQVVLPDETTSQIPEGSNRLEIVVASNLVALASLGEFEFVSAP